MDSTTIEQAKSYANANGTNLSRMVESYLLMLATAADETENGDEEITPLVKSLSGVASVPEDYDFRSDYAEYLTEKYR